MKKNLLWMLAAILCCGLLSTSCEKKEEIININQNTQQDDEPQETRSLVSIDVKYEADASQAVLENYARIGTQTLVRYVDADGNIKSEPFNGAFSKSVNIPIKKTGVNAALQVLIVPKSKEEVEAAGEQDITTNMTFTLIVNYSDNTSSEASVFSTKGEEKMCSPHWAHKPSDYDRYVSRFGGFIPAMFHIGYTVTENESSEGKQLVSSAATFWRENAYTE